MVRQPKQPQETSASSGGGSGPTRFQGVITMFQPNDRGTGHGKLRYRHHFKDKSSRFITLDFQHGQCLGEYDMPIAPGLRPVLWQPVQFDIIKDRDGRQRAAMITAPNGGPIRTKGTPIDFSQEGEGADPDTVMAETTQPPVATLTLNPGT
jgi:hypothetical protein